jgi:hypothetical protein
MSTPTTTTETPVQQETHQVSADKKRYLSIKKIMTRFRCLLAT